MLVPVVTLVVQDHLVKGISCRCLLCECLVMVTGCRGVASWLMDGPNVGVAAMVHAVAVLCMVFKI